MMPLKFLFSAAVLLTPSNEQEVAFRIGLVKFLINYLFPAPAFWSCQRSFLLIPHYCWIPQMNTRLYSNRICKFGSSLSKIVFVSSSSLMMPTGSLVDAVLLLSLSNEQEVAFRIGLVNFLIKTFENGFGPFQLSDDANEIPCQCRIITVGSLTNKVWDAVRTRAPQRRGQISSSNKWWKNLVESPPE